MLMFWASAALCQSTAAPPRAQVNSEEAILPARRRILLPVPGFVGDAGRDVRRQWSGGRASAEAGRALWDEITVALVAPPPEGDEEGIGLDGVIQQATSGLREAGQSFETLQRQERTVDHKPAQMLKVQYREKSTGHDWIEELVFIRVRTMRSIRWR